MLSRRLGRVIASASMAMTATTAPIKLPSGTTLIDTRTVQKELVVRAAARAARLALKAGAVECPRSFPATVPAAIFICTATIGGQRVPYTVSFDARSQTWTATSDVAVLPAAVIAAYVTNALKIDRASRIRCGTDEAVLVRPFGVTLACTVTAKASRATQLVLLRVAPGDGRVHLESSQ